MTEGQVLAQPAGHVTRLERRWVFIFAAVVMLLTTLPYGLGFARQAEGHIFTGFVFAVEDGNSYIAKMLSGTYAAWLFRTPYTAFPQDGVLMFLPYLLLGKLAAPPALHVQLVVLYHLFRIGAGFLAILATYDFLAYFLRQIRLRRFGLALVILGGGLGWILVLVGQDSWLGSLPLEFYSPETFGFLGLYGIAHLSLARALLLWALLAYLRASAAGPDIGLAKPALKIAALWFLAGLAQPLTTLVIGAVIGMHLVGLAAWKVFHSRRRESAAWSDVNRSDWKCAFRLAVVAGILPGLLVLYNIIAVSRDPFLQMWTAQNLILSPHPVHYLLAYGLVLPFAVVGGMRVLSLDRWRGWLLVGWALLLPVFAYLPVNLQRRLPEGGWVVLVVLAMLAVETSPRKVVQSDAKNHANRKFADFREGWSLLPFWFAFPSTLILLAGGFLTAGTTQLPVFRPADEVVLFEFLSEHAEPGDVVLAAYETGNALPAWAPLRVVIGHGPESVNLAELRPQVKAFYTSATSEQTRQHLIAQLGVRYVFWGPLERALGDWDPGQAGYLRRIHESGAYQVFEVVAEFP